MMAGAYGRGKTFLLETLETERQGVSALAAYAIAVRDGLYP